MEPVTTAPDREHLPQLDGLRAFAVLAVLWSHWTPNAYHLGVPIGLYGVLLFFVLSGFLITGILLRGRGASGSSPGRMLGSFYARRFLRIFPLFWLVLGLATLAEVPRLRESFVWHVTYLSNIYFLDRGGWHPYIGHFWSLAVEEQFYLVWPVLVLLTPTRRLMPLVVGMILLGPLTRIILLAREVSPSIVITHPLACLDALGIGAWLAVIRSGPGQGDRFRAWQRRMFFYGLSGTLGVYLLHQLYFVSIVSLGLHYTMVSLLFGWLVWRAAEGSHQRFWRILEAGPLVQLGQISYGVYLIHNFAPLMVPDFIAHQWVPGLAFMFVLTVATALLSWRWIESPLLRLKKYFPYEDPRRVGPRAPAVEFPPGDIRREAA